MTNPTQSELARKLHLAESRFEAAIQASGEMFYDWNVLTDAVFMAGPVQRYLGVAPHEITCLQDWMQFIHPEDLSSFEQETQSLAATKDHANIQYRIVHADGTIRDVEDRGFFSLDAEGRLTRMVGFVRDLSEQKKKDQILQTVQRNQVVGRMLHGVAHDLSNMTQAIMSAAREARYLCECGEAHTILFGIEHAADQTSEMLRRLTRVSQNSDHLLQPLYLKDVVLEWLEIFRPLLPAKIKITTDIRDSDIAILGDRSGIQQLLANLCMNAKDALPLGGTISISTRQILTSAGREALPRVCLRVEDTGKGLPNLDPQKLFAPFFSTKDPEEGTGLGLWIVQQIADNHKATVEAKNLLGGGAAFSVCFPALQARKSSEEFAKDLALLQQKKILLVDDDGLFLAGLDAAMKRLGISMQIAASGTEALEYVAADRDVDIVILDIDMPVLNGYQVFEQLQQQLSGATYVFVSGADEDMIQAGNIPGDKILRKPFTVETLVSYAAAALASAL